MTGWAAGMHWTFSRRAWCGFFRTLDDGRIHLRHEVIFTKLTPEQTATRVLRAAQDAGVTLSYVVAQASLWPTDTTVGETVSETLSRYGLPMQPSADDAVNGWALVRAWLQVRDWRPFGPTPLLAPTLTIHPSCREILKTLPTLVSDPKHPDDIEDTDDAIPAQGLRYFAMSRPLPRPAETPDLRPDQVGHAVREIRAAARYAEDVE